jgi:hypothetical protein
MTSSAPGRVLSYLLPSLADTLFIALFVALCYGHPRLQLLSDGGIGWHIRTGEWILQHRTVPHTDIFTGVPRTWFAWEWLFDVLIAAVHGWGSLNAVLVFSAFLTALCFALLLRWTLRKGAPLLVALTLVALAILSSTVHTLARPHLITWILTLVCWYLLDRKRWLWLLPFIVLIWVNMHGGFLVAFALIGLSLVGEALAGRKRDGFTELACVLAASFVMSLINPYGFRLYRHIFEYLSDPFIRQHNLEMQPPDIHSVGAKAFVALALFAALVLIKRFRGLRISQMLILFFLTTSAFLSVRNIPLAAIILTVTVAPLMSRWREIGSSAASRNMMDRLREFSARMSSMEAATRGHLWAILCVALGMAACLNGGQLWGNPVLQASFNPERFPLRAVEFLSQQSVQGPLFTHDAWGGYVIYREWPRLRVAVDDRHDMYGSAYMQDYLKIVHGESGWQELLNATGARSVLLMKDGVLARLLRLSPDWQMAYEDDQAVIFVRQ